MDQAQSTSPPNTISSNSSPNKSSEKVHKINMSHEENNGDMRIDKLFKKAKMIKKELKKKSASNQSDNDKPTTHFQLPTLVPGKASLKWMIIVLNVVIELIQAVLAQEAAEGLISNANYAKFCVVSSAVCLIISVSDIAYEAKEGDVKWRRKGTCFWLYYPGKHGRIFGSVWLIVGFLSSIVQFSLNLVGLVTNMSSFTRFQYLPLLLSVCFFVAAVSQGRKTMWGVIKCNDKHGRFEIEGRFVHGRWLFECPSCKIEGSV